MRSLNLTRPSQVDVDAAFPVAGKARNITVTGDNTGTPWIADVINDRTFGWQENVLKRTGTVANGNPEDATSSQIAQAMALVSSVAAQGKNLAGSTRYGCTLNSANDWVIHTDGSYWQWLGMYPKVVAVSEVPSAPNYLMVSVGEFDQTQMNVIEDLIENHPKMTAVSGGGVLSVNKINLITDASTYTLPPTTDLANGSYVEVVRFGTALLLDPTPTIQVDGGNTETINYYNEYGTLDSSDTSILYNITSQLMFIFNAVSGNWEL